MSALLTIVIAPLMACLAVVSLRRGAAWWALAGALLSLAASIALALTVTGTGGFVVDLEWLPLLTISLSAQPLNVLLALMVATVSFLVFVFAVGYMSEEPGRVRFFALISLFLAAMQVLVLAGDWLLLLMAWELIGFCSYALIGHWHWRDGVPAAATRAFLYTRSADVGLFVAVFVLVARSGSTDLETTLAAGPVPTAVGLLLLLAVMGKSAQVPLQGWLQRAMAGPTPVSALLHSATLVAAGAILLIRAAPLLTAEVAFAAALVGGATAVAGGIMALAATDLKRLLAASTSSQYGLMLLAVGAGYPAAALMHLVAHAAIKSSLFLEAGALQKAYGSTALSALRGAARSRRGLGVAVLLSGLALAGIPPLSGMFSKDAILAAALQSDYALTYFGLALLGVLLSGAYVGRALQVLWKGEASNEKLPHPLWFGIGLGGLTLLAVTLGPVLKPILHWATEAEIPKSQLAFAAGLIAALAGLAWGWWMERPLPAWLAGWGERGLQLAGGWNVLLARPVQHLAHACERLDQTVHSGVEGFAAATARLARGTRRSDEQGIDGAIAALITGVRRFGDGARRLQTGLIHRELMFTAGGTALTLVLIVVLAT